MVTHGIKDKVAVIGCDATKYGELWDKSKEDLLFEATNFIVYLYDIFFNPFI